MEPLSTRGLTMNGQPRLSVHKALVLTLLAPERLELRWPGTFRDHVHAFRCFAHRVQRWQVQAGTDRFDRTLFGTTPRGQEEPLTFQGMISSLGVQQYPPTYILEVCLTEPLAQGACPCLTAPSTSASWRA